MKKILLFAFAFGFVFSFENVSDAAIVSSYTLNGQSSDVVLNPNDAIVSISVVTNIPVKFSTLAICTVSDSVCSRSTSVKYFTQTASFSNSVLKDWDGKTGGTSPTIVSNGEYRLKLTSKDENNNDVTEELAPYKITVSTSVIIAPTDNSGTTTTATSTGSTATSTNTSSSNNSPSSYYVYSSSVSLSTYEPLSLGVEAGRERLAFLHTPLEFKSYTQDKKTGKSISGAKYYWTFGDGSSADGSNVSHTFLFPGVYNVVLNSSLGEDDAVDITKVKVVEPSVSVVVGDLYLEFINENSTDLNIGGWKIKTDTKEYLLPRDTIVSVGEKIKIAFTTLGVSSINKLLVFYPDSQLAFENTLISNEEKQKQISQLSEKLLAIQNQMYLAYGDASVSPFVIPAEAEIQSENSELGLLGVPEDDKQGDGNGKQVTGENIASSISSPASQSVLSKIADFFGTMFK